MDAPVPPQSARERAAARLAVCKSCPLLSGRRPLERCQACGCLVRGLVVPRSAVCPRGKW